MQWVLAIKSVEDIQNNVLEKIHNSNCHAGACSGSPQQCQTFGSIMKAIKSTEMSVIGG